MLQCPVDGIALSGPELVEIPVNPLPGLESGCSVPPAQIPRDILTRQHCLGNVIEEHGRNIPRGKRPALKLEEGVRGVASSQIAWDSTVRQMASVNSVVDAAPPRSWVRIVPSVRTFSSAARMRLAASRSPM